jgi:hypothetical protein
VVCTCLAIVTGGCGCREDTGTADRDGATSSEKPRDDGESAPARIYGFNVMRVDEVDVEAARKAFLELFVARIKEIAPRYAELEGFPNEGSAGEFILNETVYREESKRPGSKLREGPGKIVVRTMDAGEEEQRVWEFGLIVVTKDWTPPDKWFDLVHCARVVFDCRTGNAELRQEIMQIAGQCFQELAEQ